MGSPPRNPEERLSLPAASLVAGRAGVEAAARVLRAEAARLRLRHEPAGAEAAEAQAVELERLARRLRRWEP